MRLARRTQSRHDVDDRTDALADRWLRVWLRKKMTDHVVAQYKDARIDDEMAQPRPP